MGLQLGFDFGDLGRADFGTAGRRPVAYDVRLQPEYGPTHGHGRRRTLLVEKILSKRDRRHSSHETGSAHGAAALALEVCPVWADDAAGTDIVIQLVAGH